MVAEAFGGRFDDPQDAAAGKLCPQLGEYPTGRVYFNTLVMLGIANEVANESIDEAERFNNAIDHSRAISEVQDAVANEMQQGASMTSG
jgi:hypothetical protein